MTMNEFTLIENFFAKQHLTRNDVALGIGDDCALVEVPAKQQLAITTDTLVAGVHFSELASAYDIGYKSLAVNLSDLAAMGATPAWFTLALTLPKPDPVWLKDFCHGLFTLAQHHQTQLIGGDLTRGSLTITIATHGFIPKGQALKRSGAKAGDFIYVTHRLGDAALGLLSQQNKISLAQPHQNYLMTRLNRPEPRIQLGELLRGIASAAIDISDGLASDLGHILEMSQVGATIYVDDLPLSDALINSVSSEQAIELALRGGDDYELCFTVPKEKIALIPPDCRCIGVITEKKELDLRFKDGNSYNGATQGYQHF